MLHHEFPCFVETLHRNVCITNDNTANITINVKSFVETLHRNVCITNDNTANITINVTSFVCITNDYTASITINVAPQRLHHKRQHRNISINIPNSLVSQKKRGCFFCLKMSKRIKCTMNRNDFAKMKPNLCTFVH